MKLLSYLESLVLVENHLRGCYSNYNIIAKQRALVYRVLTVFTDNQSCLEQFICPRNARYHK